MPNLSTTRPREQWSQRIKMSSALLSLIGAAVLVLGWRSVASESVYAEQVPGINMAAGGVLVAGAGSILWLLAGRRAVRLRRLTVLADLRSMPRPESHGMVHASTSQALVAGEGLRRFHRSDCTMAQGRHWSAASRLDHELAGRVACGVCRP
jgi:hypothetical protein